MTYVTQSGYINILTMIIFFYISLDYSINNYPKNHIKTIIIVSVLVSIYGIMQHFDLDYFTWKQKSPNFESISTIGNSNLLGLFLNLTLPVTVISLFKPGQIKGKIFYIFSSLSMLLCLYFTYSRGALLSLLLSLPLWFIILWKFNLQKIWKKYVILILIIAILTGTLVILNKNLFYKEYIKFTGIEPIKVRIFLWEAAIKVILESPLIGSGFNTYSYKYLKYRYDEPEINRNRLAFAENSHNEFLDIAVSIGIPGALALLYFLYLILYGGFKVLNNLSEEESIILKGSLIGTLTYIINLNSVFSEISSLIFFWYLLSLILTIQIKYKQDLVKTKTYSLEFINKKVIKCFIIILFLFFAIIGQYHITQLLMANYYISSGNDLINEGNNKKASKFIIQALELDITNWNYWLTMAKNSEAILSKIHDNKELFENIEDAYKNAIRLNPLNPYPHADLGRLYSSFSYNFGTEFLDKSIIEYEKALQIDPYNIFFYNDLGTVYSIKKDYRSAIEIYRKSLKIYNKPSTQYLLGKTLLYTGNLDESEINLKKAIENDPSLEDAYFNLGILYIKKGKKEEAFNIIDKAFYLNPKNIEIGAIWLKLAREIK